MNKYLRGLLSGASFAALNIGMFAATRTARAATAHIDVTTPAHAAITNTGLLDYIWVHAGGEVVGNIVNQGTIGPPGGTPGGAVEITGAVDGIISNADLITIPASTTAKWGIQVGGAQGAVLGIYNAGTINVQHRGGAGGAISVSSHAHVGSIVNTGLIYVTGTGQEYGFIETQRGSVTRSPGISSAQAVVAKFQNGAGGHLTVTGHLVASGASLSRDRTMGHVHGLIRQRAINLGSGKATASIANAGAIKLSNVGTANATGSSPVAAKLTVSIGGSAPAIVQEAAAGSHALASLTNTGTLAIHGSARAYGGFRDDARAIVVGIGQSAQAHSSVSHLDRATVQFFNHSGGDHLSIKAQAKATGSRVAVTTTHYTRTSGGSITSSGTNSYNHVVHDAAHAVVSQALIQHVSHAGHLSAVIHNGAVGRIAIDATATAKHINYTSASHHAVALADAHIEEAILQRALHGQSAKLGITNNASASLQIKMSAFASANSGNAYAYAWQRQSVHTPGALVVQSAQDIGKVTELLDNHGTFKITASALATAQSGRAVAQAVGGGHTIVAQYSGSFTTAYNIQNQAGINGILQHATNDVGTAKLTLSNSGNLTVKAIAVAQGGRTDSALARLGQGIAQSAVASSGMGRDRLINAGHLKIRAAASTNGASHIAKATAEMSAGIAQYARGGNTALASISNRHAAHTASDISISAYAGANAFGHIKAHTATAFASVSHGIRQQAGSSSGSTRSASALLHNNNGDLKIKASAAAGASYVAKVDAVVDEGIAQTAVGSHYALAQVTNAGNLAITAKASGHAYLANVTHANAHIDSGIFQQASAGNSVHAVFTNLGGTVSIQATASAGGSGLSGPAHHAAASAYILHGLQQVAKNTAAGFTFHAATANLYNSGTILVHAEARAVAAAFSGNASGRAKLGFVSGSGAIITAAYFAISQSGLGRGGAGRAKITNHGYLTLSASASVVGHATGDARATVLGIHQKATGRTATAQISNTRFLGLTAQANATANGASAVAHIGVTATHALSGISGSHGIGYNYQTQRIHGISQIADGTHKVLAEIENSGTLMLRAKAEAEGHGAANAIANVVGIYQFADPAPPPPVNATASFSNQLHGHLQVLATAVAKSSGSGTGAFARAGVSEALHQKASGAILVKDKLVNVHGATITLSAHATANTNAVNSVHGHAEARMFRPLWQQAQSFATARLDIENSGNIKLNIDASAKGGVASAYAYQKMRHAFNGDTGLGLINQTASGSSSASASDLINNHGTIRIVEQAKAVASTGRALAMAAAAADRSTPIHNDYHALHGIVQSAAHVDAANLKLNNAGTLNIKALATAQGPGFVTAIGWIDAAVSQRATNNVSRAYMMVSNAANGDIAVTAAAKVSGAQTGEGVARAYINNGIRQRATAGDTASLSVINHGTIHFSAKAAAKGGSEMEANAFVFGGVRQSAEDADVQALLFKNSAGARLSAKASGLASGLSAHAYPGVADVVRQDTDDGAHQQLTVDNSGVLSVMGQAVAIASARQAIARVGDEDGIVITQEAFLHSGQSASLGVFNRAHGSILANDFAQAVAPAGPASASAWTVGVKQRLRFTATAANARATVSNAGNIALTAKASIQGTKGQVTGRVTGIVQSADRDNSGATAATATLAVINSGNLKVEAVAVASGAARNVVARAAGVLQNFYAVDGVADFTNSGHITVAAIATGHSAKAEAVGLGVTGSGGTYTRHSLNHNFTGSYPGSLHIENGYSELAVHVVNSGSLKVTAIASGAGAVAKATGIAISPLAVTSKNYARSSYTGVHRTRNSEHEQAKALSGVIENDGALLVSAKAVGGKANALGIGVIASELDAAIQNGVHGVLSAKATGKTAAATGLTIKGQGRNSAEVDHDTGSFTFNATDTMRDYPIVIAGNIVNDGVIKASAKGTATAHAQGIAVNEFLLAGSLRNNNKITVLASGAKARATGIHVFGASVSRIVKSSGTSSDHPAHHASSTVVTNVVNGFSGTLENDGSIKVTAKGANARAAGIIVDVSSFTGSIINKGSIAAEADGAGGQAVAIKVTDFPALPPGPGIISNIGGTISAKLVNGGVTTWGTAIDVTGAPGVVNIGLSGNGNIYGNVKLKSDSTINVSGSGVTFLSGVINPSKTKAGTITIAAGGNLELANDATQGNAKAYVTSFTQPGTLSVDIGSVANATPYINAGAATLGGALVVVPGGTLPAANTTYRIVLSDAALSTTWSGVTIKGAPALLSASAVYLPNEADISLTVTPAGDLGLTPNQLATLTPFEQTLAGLLGQTSIDPSSALGKLVTALFTLTLPQLTDVLDQLGNQDAGAQTQSNLSFATALLDQILNHLGTGGATGGVASLPNMPAGVRPAQMTTGAGTIWGGLYGAHASTKSVAGVPGSSTSLTGLYAGYDLALDTDLLAGVAAAYSTDTSKTGGGHGSANGFQVSPYLRLTRDSGFFANADVSYGLYTNKLSRTLTIPGLGTGTNTGKFDSNVFSAYAEAGQSFANGSLTLSPYAALAYARADAGAYTETGALTGTLLHVNGATSQTLTSYLGAGLSETFALDGGGTITPRMRFAWAHDYSGSAWQVNAGFAALPGSGFVIRGPGLSREKAYINAALDLHLSDDVETSLNYDALFNDDQSQQSLMGVLRFSF